MLLPCISFITESRINVENKTVYAIILAAGVGSRMGTDSTKQTMLLGGRSVIARTVGTFYECECIDGIVVVGRECELDFLENELLPYSKKIHKIISGGSTRCESARLGFGAIPPGVTHIAIHDGARPLVTEKIISDVVERAIECGAATDATPIYDTVKQIDENGAIVGTLDRKTLVGARTPQAFSAEIYARALENTDNCDSITDDNMMVEALGITVVAVVSDTPNPKITVMDDLKYADFLLKEREKANV